MARGSYNFDRRTTERIAKATRTVENLVRVRPKRRPRSSHDVINGPRRAKLQANATGSTVDAKLLDADGAEVADTISVQLFTTGDSTFPVLSSGDDIPVFKDLNGTWYACFVMIPFTECAP
mgnify:CR=1 FL=1|tara:strand:+ start:13327 stop:13689 length:363 start_codon:yes stop_codon:yes gene_type:complete